MKCLAVILFHNDEDLVEDQIDHMIANKHDIIVFDHCSTDATREIVKKNQHRILKYYELGPELIFQNNEVFVHISKILQKEYNHYDWISFIESDEFLEGPDRSKSYYEHLLDVHKTEYTWITFDNFVFWFTEKDDPTISSPRLRIKHYAYKKDCAERVYAWRGHLTSIRFFNHNPPINGTKLNKCPTPFRTAHYEIRSKEHAFKKLEDRVKRIDHILEDKHNPIPVNIHYKMMHNKIDNIALDSSKFHYDDGGELIADDIYDFRDLYNDNEMHIFISELRKSRPVRPVPPIQKRQIQSKRQYVVGRANHSNVKINNGQTLNSTINRVKHNRIKGSTGIIKPKIPPK